MTQAVDFNRPTTTAKILFRAPGCGACKGFPGYIHGSWYGLIVPARTPVAIINRLYVESVKVLKDQELVAVLTRDSGVAGGNTPQDSAREIREEIAELAKVIQAAKIRL